MSLSSDLNTIFNDMKTMNEKPDGWQPPKDDNGNIKPIGEWDQDAWPIKLKDVNRYMADECAAAFVTFIQSGKTVGSTYSGSIDLGTVSETVAGTFTSINASENESAAADIIYNACIKMNNDGENASNDDLWKAYANAMSKIVAGTVVVETLLGTAVPPATPPPTVPVSGTAEGSLSDPAKSAFEAAMKLIPAAMGTTGQDSIKANMMGAAAIAYAAAITVSLKGDTPGVTEGLSASNVLVGAA